MIDIGLSNQAARLVDGLAQPAQHDRSVRKRTLLERLSEACLAASTFIALLQPVHLTGFLHQGNTEIAAIAAFVADALGG